MTCYTQRQGKWKTWMATLTKFQAHGPWLHTTEPQVLYRTQTKHSSPAATCMLRTSEQAWTHLTHMAHMSTLVDWLRFRQKWTFSKWQSAPIRCRPWSILVGAAGRGLNIAVTLHTLKLHLMTPREKWPLCFCLDKRPQHLLCKLLWAQGQPRTTCFSQAHSTASWMELNKTAASYMKHLTTMKWPHFP